MKSKKIHFENATSRRQRTMKSATKQRTKSNFLNEYFIEFDPLTDCRLWVLGFEPSQSLSVADFPCHACKYSP
jgi:hypothetical protein